MLSILGRMEYDLKILNCKVFESIEYALCIYTSEYSLCSRVWRKVARSLAPKASESKTQKKKEVIF